MNASWLKCSMVVIGMCRGRAAFGSTIHKHRTNRRQHRPSVKVIVADSQHLAPAKFFLFPRLKLALKGLRFTEIEDIKQHNAASDLTRRIF